MITRSDALHHIQDVGAVNDGLALAGQRLDERLETDRRVGIQSVQRLVEKDHRRIVQQRGCNDHLTPHALGVGAQQFVGQRLEAESKNAMNCRMRSRAASGGMAYSARPFPGIPGPSATQTAPRTPGQSRPAVLLRLFPEQIKSADCGGAAGGGEHAGEHFQRGRFSGAVWPRNPGTICPA